MGDLYSYVSRLEATIRAQQKVISDSQQCSPNTINGSPSLTGSPNPAANANGLIINQNLTPNMISASSVNNHLTGTGKFNCHTNSTSCSTAIGSNSITSSDLTMTASASNTNLSKNFGTESGLGSGGSLPHSPTDNKQTESIAKTEAGATKTLEVRDSEAKTPTKKENGSAGEDVLLSPKSRKSILADSKKDGTVTASSATTAISLSPTPEKAESKVGVSEETKPENTKTVDETSKETTKSASESGSDTKAVAATSDSTENKAEEPKTPTKSATESADKTDKKIGEEVTVEKKDDKTDSTKTDEVSSPSKSTAAADDKTVVSPSKPTEKDKTKKSDDKPISTSFSTSKIYQEFTPAPKSNLGLTPEKNNSSATHPQSQSQTHMGTSTYMQYGHPSSLQRPISAQSNHMGQTQTHWGATTMMTSPDPNNPSANSTGMTGAVDELSGSMVYNPQTSSMQQQPQGQWGQSMTTDPNSYLSPRSGYYRSTTTGQAIAQTPAPVSGYYTTNPNGTMTTQTAPVQWGTPAPAQTPMQPSGMWQSVTPDPSGSGGVITQSMDQSGNIVYTTQDAAGNVVSSSYGVPAQTVSGTVGAVGTVPSQSQSMWTTPAPAHGQMGTTNPLDPNNSVVSQGHMSYVHPTVTPDHNNGTQGTQMMTQTVIDSTTGQLTTVTVPVQSQNTQGQIAHPQAHPYGSGQMSQMQQVVGNHSAHSHMSHMSQMSQMSSVSQNPMNQSQMSNNQMNQSQLSAGSSGNQSTSGTGPLGGSSNMNLLQQQLCNAGPGGGLPGLGLPPPPLMPNGSNSTTHANSGNGSSSTRSMGQNSGPGNRMSKSMSKFGASHSTHWTPSKRKGSGVDFSKFTPRPPSQGANGKGNGTGLTPGKDNKNSNSKSDATASRSGSASGTNASRNNGNKDNNGPGNAIDIDNLSGLIASEFDNFDESIAATEVMSELLDLDTMDLDQFNDLTEIGVRRLTDSDNEGSGSMSSKAGSGNVTTAASAAAPALPAVSPPLIPSLASNIDDLVPPKDAPPAVTVADVPVPQSVPQTVNVVQGLFDLSLDATPDSISAARSQSPCAGSGGSGSDENGDDRSGSRTGRTASANSVAETVVSDNTKKYRSDFPPLPSVPCPNGGSGAATIAKCHGTHGTQGQSLRLSQTNINTVTNSMSLSVTSSTSSSCPTTNPPPLPPVPSAGTLPVNACSTSGADLKSFKACDLFKSKEGSGAPSSPTGPPSVVPPVSAVSTVPPPSSATALTSVSGSATSLPVPVAASATSSSSSSSGADFIGSATNADLVVDSSIAADSVKSPKATTSLNHHQALSPPDFEKKGLDIAADVSESKDAQGSATVNDELESQTAADTAASIAAAVVAESAGAGGDGTEPATLDASKSAVSAASVESSATETKKDSATSSATGPTTAIAKASSQPVAYSKLSNNSPSKSNYNSNNGKGNNSMSKYHQGGNGYGNKGNHGGYNNMNGGHSNNYRNNGNMKGKGNHNNQNNSNHSNNSKYHTGGQGHHSNNVNGSMGAGTGWYSAMNAKNTGNSSSNMGPYNSDGTMTNTYGMGPGSGANGYVGPGNSGGKNGQGNNNNNPNVSNLQTSSNTNALLASVSLPGKHRKWAPSQAYVIHNQKGMSNLTPLTIGSNGNPIPSVPASTVTPGNLTGPGTQNQMSQTTVTNQTTMLNQQSTTAMSAMSSNSPLAQDYLSNSQGNFAAGAGAYGSGSASGRHVNNQAAYGTTPGGSTMNSAAPTFQPGPQAMSAATAAMSTTPGQVAGGVQPYTTGYVPAAPGAPAYGAPGPYFTPTQPMMQPAVGGPATGYPGMTAPGLRPPPPAPPAGGFAGTW